MPVRGTFIIYFKTANYIVIILAPFLQVKMVDTQPRSTNIVLRTGDVIKEELKDYKQHLVLDPQSTDYMPAITKPRAAIKEILQNIQVLNKDGQNGVIYDAIVIKNTIKGMAKHVVIKTVDVRTERMHNSKSLRISPSEKALEEIERAALFKEFQVHARVNYLRKFIPNFALLIGALSCPAKTSQEITDGGLCEIEVEKPDEVHLILEKVGDTGDIEEGFDGTMTYTLESILESQVSGDKEVRAETFFRGAVQVLASLAIAQDKIQFGHNDLHGKNVLMVPIQYPLERPKGFGAKKTPGQKLFLKYNLPHGKEVHIETDRLAVILDFGLSRANDPKTGETVSTFTQTQAEIGISPKFNPIYDPWLFIKRCTSDELAVYGKLFPETVKYLNNLNLVGCIDSYESDVRPGFPKYNPETFSGASERAHKKEALFLEIDNKSEIVYGYKDEKCKVINPEMTAQKVLEVLLEEAKGINHRGKKMYNVLCEPASHDKIVEFEIEIQG